MRGFPAGTGQEDGVALVTVILVSLIVFLLGAVSVGLAVHNSGASAYERMRLQSVNAAEAGVNEFLAYLERTPPSELSCDRTISLQAFPGTATAQVHADLYDVSGSLLSCPPTGGPVPASALITSVGSASGGVPRKVQAQVRLTPVWRGIGAAILASEELELKNILTVNGYSGNDAGIYVGGDADLSNRLTVFGSLYAQGSAELSNAANLKGELWARGSVSLSNNAEVGGDVTSSQGGVSLSGGSRIGGSARAATTVSISGNSRVDGLVIQGSPSGPPPSIALPEIEFREADWTAAGFGIQSFSDCSSAAQFITALPSGNWAVRISPACRLAFRNNTTLGLPGDLAIVTDGSVSLANNVTVKGVGGVRKLFIIVTWRPGLDCDSGAYDISTANSTGFQDVQVFLYTPCSLRLANWNQITGQLFAGEVNIANQMTLNYMPLLVPGYGQLAGFKVDLVYIREVRP